VKTFGTVIDTVAQGTSFDGVPRRVPAGVTGGSAS
jgi:hypothetical protein